MIASVPLQGTYLPYSICAKLPKKWIKFPSPCRGLIFLTSKKFIRKGAEKGFRPLAGDLSSLQVEFAGEQGGKRPFPSPCRGLIFLTNSCAI